MSIWRVLEIDATTDIAVIKKAYAKKLKQHHPEDDPEGYQQLREAYDAAIKQAGKQANRERSEAASNVEDLSDTDERSAIPVQPVQPVYLQDHLPLQSKPDVQEQIGQFIDQASAIYSDIRTRIDTNKWSELFNADVIWDLKLRPLAGRRLYAFLNEHRLLPKNVWLLIESCFQWKANLDLDESDPDPFMRHYIRQLEGPELRFGFLDPRMGMETIDRFLYLRNAASQSLQDDNLELAKPYIDEASEIFRDDPDLLRLQGELHIRRYEQEEALDVYARIIRLCPSELDGYIGGARILFELNRFTEAIELCETALAWDRNHRELQFLLGKSLKNNGDANRAIAVFESLKSSFPHDLELNIILRGLHRATSEQRRPRPQRLISLTPSRRYRLKPGKEFILFVFIALSLFTMLYSDPGGTYKEPIAITSPDQLTQADYFGQSVRVALTGTALTKLFSDAGRIVRDTQLDSLFEVSDHKAGLQDLIYDRIGAGYLGDSLVMSVIKLNTGESYPRGSRYVTGELMRMTMLEQDADIIKEQFGSEAPLISGVIIDTTASRPRTKLYIVVLVLRVLSLLYSFWYLARLAHKLYRSIREV